MRQLRMGVNTISCTDTYHLTIHLTIHLNMIHMILIHMINNCDQCEFDEKF